MENVIEFTSRCFSDKLKKNQVRITPNLIKISSTHLLPITPYNRLSGEQMLSGTQIISTSHGMTEEGEIISQPSFNIFGLISFTPIIFRRSRLVVIAWKM
jgi:hypothetical protein